MTILLNLMHVTATAPEAFPKPGRKAIWPGNAAGSRWYGGKSTI
jgi:hypothetical protein